MSKLLKIIVDISPDRLGGALPFKFV